MSTSSSQAQPAGTMASDGRGPMRIQSSRFTQHVVDAMRKLYPEEFADRTWDNVGLLVGNVEPPAPMNKVLVTNDITLQVALDAVAQKASVIVSYHPFIFSGLKAVTNEDPHQSILLLLARHNIAVYSPHTAVDAAPSGLNTWLADLVAGPHATDDTVAVACAAASPPPEQAGYGRIRHFQTAHGIPLAEILKRLADGLGGLRHVMVASPAGLGVATTSVRSFAVCAGSGYDVLKKADVDLLVMGETNHHSALRATLQNRTLVQVLHSNSERGYLQTELRSRLQAELRAKVPDVEVVVSQYDRDPWQIVDVRELS